MALEQAQAEALGKLARYEAVVRFDDSCPLDQVEAARDVVGLPTLVQRRVYLGRLAHVTRTPDQAQPGGLAR